MDNLYKTEDEFQIAEILNLLLNKKFQLFLSFALSLFLSIVLSISIPNQYTSRTKLAPVNQEDFLTPPALGLNNIGIAGGFSTLSQNASVSDEAIEIMQSFDFFSTYFIENINLEDLMASKNWDDHEDKVLYDDDIFDKTNKSWKVKKNGLSKKPSLQNSYKVYKDILVIVEDQKTGFLNISITHHSPNIAKKWLDLIISSINEKLRSDTIERSTSNINFLNKSIVETNLNELKIAISNLLEMEIQKLMLATGNEDYVYKTLDSPVAPEEKSMPRRSLLVIFYTFLGTAISIIYLLLVNYFIPKIKTNDT